MKKLMEVNKDLMVDPTPVVKLTNGLHVMNFCSGHPFIFEDGTILPACSDERVERLKLISDDECYEQHIEGMLDVDMVIKVWYLSEELIREIARVWNFKGIVLVPLPLLQAIRRRHNLDLVDLWEDVPFRSIFRVNRDNSTGPGKIACDKFCITL